jgi:hypothetical protein
MMKSSSIFFFELPCDVNSGFEQSIFFNYTDDS